MLFGIMPAALLLASLLLLTACSSPQGAPTEGAGSTSFATSTSVQSVTPTLSPTSTLLPAPTPTLAPTPSPTSTLLPAPTPTLAPTLSPTSTLLPAPTPTLAPTPSPTSTLPPAPTPTLTPTPELQYLTQDIPPCTPAPGSSVDPCEPAPEETGTTESDGLTVTLLGDAPAGVEAFLDFPVDNYKTHVVLRGTYLPGTARCTTGHRHRYPSYVTPGSLGGALIIHCFADVRVNAYLLGSGPSTLTVIVASSLYAYGGADDDDYGLEQLERRRSAYERALAEGGQFEYDLPLRGYLAPGSADPLRLGYLPGGGLVAIGPPGGIGGREVVLFLGPSTSLSIEVWQVLWTWDVERREDGTVIAVHPDREWFDLETHRSVLEMELPAFTQAVTAANQERVTEYGGRIAPEDIDGRAEGVDLPMLVDDANELSQFFTDIGAYDHPDGPPAQPPPPCGLAVPDQADNPGLMKDCMSLLAARDTLRGTATLNWSVDTAIADWEGITTGGTPSRVTEMELPNEGLSGSIPAELGDLLGLTHLDLSDNDLTGEIPRELGQPENLEELRLSGNNLTGCIPEALRDVENHDLALLGLGYCDELDYDGDNDSLIEVSTLSQLNAIRWDLDGDGSATDPAYDAAFPNAQAGMGCPSAGCTGYELTADLDFDTDGSGLVDSGDEYWNGSSGWDPIGEAHNRSFDATFEGNGHTVSNLFINRVHTNDIGLFGNTSAGSVIRNVGLFSAGITGSWSSGGLVGYNRGTITDSYVAGKVTGSNRVGDLVGWNHGGTVTGSYASGNVTGSRYAGGLIGLNMGTVTNSYATGDVTGVESVGGLVGDNYTGTVTNSYATGKVTGESLVGGLVGENDDGTVTDSYWDTETTGLSTSDGGAGKTTVELRSPISNTGIYASWDNAAWDFGTSEQYPVLK